MIFSRYMMKKKVWSMCVQIFLDLASICFFFFIVTPNFRLLCVVLWKFMSGAQKIYFEEVIGLI